MKIAQLFLILFIVFLPSAVADDGNELATFAGGCFWCMEPPFEKLDGVISARSGYAGGEEKNPTYKQVAAGRTGHTEVVQIEFDPSKITYQQLLEVYWRNTDPTTNDRQFCDRGQQYRPAIFFHNSEQQKLAQESKVEIEKTKRFPQPIVTEISKLDEFYPAEEYHQDFYKKNPSHYQRYRRGCGRDARLKELWGQ